MTKSLAKEPAIELPVLRRVAAINPKIDLVNDFPDEIKLDGLDEDQKKEATDALAKLRKETLAYPAYGEMLAKNNVLAS